ncbi:hypothetical protein P3X46_017647 [Hevea brasiliensis]|uniref:Late embryogenesis abundant protein LEA-2 subgroup domain-containing protein n=1 Tax=Hevea brasiliensis TaxID=3981 RepID=A0ABQ9LRF8_HEVBR|nr:uncharacterized protein LOC110651758 [Hevea brasiliensis]KAJ9169450.1 hypothetical protein P3X46_017647 [Hevea brasiliensis]
MTHHPETNPHFIRPLRQREAQRPRAPSTPGRTPPTSRLPSPTPSAPGRTPPTSGLPSPPPQHWDRQDQPTSEKGHDDGPFQAPLKQHAAPRQDQHPHPVHDQRHDGEYRRPWMFPHSRDEDHHNHDPGRDGKYHSPWILPLSQHDEDIKITPQQNRPPQQDQHRKQPKRTRTTQPQDKDHYPLHPNDGLPPAQRQQQDGFRHLLGLKAPAPQQTRPIIWLGAALCAIFWILIILGGLIVLIVYLVYRPRSPEFEVSSVTLNAAYIDAGSLLNADISVLANFTNPNKKVGLEFSHMIIDLYYGNTLIATQYIESFSAPKAESRFANVHMVTSQARLPLGDSAQLQDQMNRSGIIFNVKGVFRVRSKLGSLLAYSNRFYGHCIIMVTAPPTGVLRAARCTTKR